MRRPRRIGLLFLILFAFLLAISPALHAYIHPYELLPGGVSTCWTTGYSLTLASAESPLRLLRIPQAGNGFSLPQPRSPFSLVQIFPSFSRAPPFGSSS